MRSIACHSEVDGNSTDEISVSVETHGGGGWCAVAHSRLLL